MDAVLTGSLVTIRVDDRVILRALPDRQGDEITLTEDGTAISARSPVASLLDRSDVIAALQPGGARLTVFWRGGMEFGLQLRRLRSGLDLIIRTPDGRIFDAHEMPIMAILPVALVRGVPA